MENNKVTEQLKRGVRIYAKFPQNIVLAYEVLCRNANFDGKTDKIHMESQHHTGITIVKYVGTETDLNYETGEKTESRTFIIISPEKDMEEKKLPEGVVQTKEDIHV